MSAPGQEPPDDALATALLEAQLEVAETVTRKAAAADSAAEAQAFAQAQLLLVQGIVMMDPNRIQGGDTPEARKASTPTPSTRDSDRDGKIGEK